MIRREAPTDTILLDALLRRIRGAIFHHEGNFAQVLRCDHRLAGGKAVAVEQKMKRVAPRTQ